MTLDEAFLKYNDQTKLERHINCKGHTIEWLKKLKIIKDLAYRIPDLKIPQSWIDEANADDWELFNETH